jgi:hypothetical protein
VAELWRHYISTVAALRQRHVALTRHCEGSAAGALRRLCGAVAALQQRCSSAVVTPWRLYCREAATASR